MVQCAAKEGQATLEKHPPKMLYAIIFGEAFLMTSVVFVCAFLLYATQQLSALIAVVSCLIVATAIATVAYSIRHQRQAGKIVTSCLELLWFIAVAYVAIMASSARGIVYMLIPEVPMLILLVPENLQYQPSRNGMIVRSILAFGCGVLVLPFNLSNPVGILLCGLLAIISLANAIATIVYFNVPRRAAPAWLGRDMADWMKVILLICVIVGAGFAIWFVISIYGF